MFRMDRTRFIISMLLLVAFLGYTGILYSSQPGTHPGNDALAARGKQLWQQYNCVACHQVYGLGGYLGPDLTNVYSRKGPDHVRAFLRSGTNIMPNFKLSEADMDALTAYFNIIDQSGSADPRTFNIHPNGTIEQ